MDELSFLCCQFSLRRTLRRDRIEKIVVGAVKQSRKSFMPQVNEMQGFREFITAERPGRKFIAHCYEEFARNDMYQLLQETASEEDVTVLVGPEGDFSVEEVRLAMEHGYESVTLGSSRLRTETAGLASVMMFNLLRRR
jgi:16S rRNA (uracil1498-N3)-methyltransferase